MQHELPSLTMTKREYVNKIKQMFAYYGFTNCPLSLGRLSWLYDYNVPIVAAYRIGCDVAAGFSFLQSVNENR